ncbi:solute carrier family 66 member 3 [Battus philenor]|uniref:solute carrier family 66 member 3 n=1 Tax=Battus philenor TaxID=42288 RepID=UPI0035CF8861
MDDDILQYIANTLSTITIASCLVLKVPQIMYVRKTKSAESLYIQAMLMEILGFTIVTLYNYTNRYNIMTYLEYPIILVQAYVLLYYVMKYQYVLGCPMVPFATFAYFITVLGFGTGFMPKYLLSYMVPFCTPLSGFAKVTYIYGIVKCGNANGVSLTTWIISVATNMSRLFTVYVDSADLKLMINFTISTLLSSGVLLTALIYQLKCSSNDRKTCTCKKYK